MNHPHEETHFLPISLFLHRFLLSVQFSRILIVTVAFPSSIQPGHARQRGYSIQEIGPQTPPPGWRNNNLQPCRIISLNPRQVAAVQFENIFSGRQIAIGRHAFPTPSRVILINAAERESVLIQSGIITAWHRERQGETVTIVFQFQLLFRIKIGNGRCIVPKISRADQDFRPPFIGLFRGGKRQDTFLAAEIERAIL